MIDDVIAPTINNIKKDLVKSLAMYSLTTDDKDNNNALLDSVLLSWFKDIKNSEDFCTKYNSLDKLFHLENIFYLFNLVNIIENDDMNKRDRITVAINLYHKIINDPEYQNLSLICGYELPKDFLDEEKYLNSTLYQNVKFIELFRKELEIINQELIAKENKRL